MNSMKNRLDGRCCCYHAGLLSFVVSLLALPVLELSGQEAAGASALPHPAEVQLDSSRVFVFADKKGLGHQHAVEARLLPSRLRVGAEKDAGELVFDMKSFDADTDAARKRLGLSGSTDAATRKAVNDNLHSAAVLDVARYPTATFEVLSAKATGEKNASGLPTYRLEGNFTLHGVTRPQSINVQVDQVRGWLRVRGAFAILQTSFGIKPFSKALGAVGVADELKIYGELFVAPTEHINLADIPAHH